MQVGLHFRLSQPPHFAHGWAGMRGCYAGAERQMVPVQHQLDSPAVSSSHYGANQKKDKAMLWFNFHCVCLSICCLSQGALGMCPLSTDCTEPVHGLRRIRGSELSWDLPHQTIWL